MYGYGAMQPAGGSGAAAVGEVVLFNDTFTDTNGTLLENHTPDLGTGWTLSGGSGGVIIQSGAMYTGTIGTPSYWLHDDIGSADKFSSCIMDQDTLHVLGTYLMIMRIVDANTWGAALEISGAGTWRTIKSTGGSRTALAADTGVNTGSFNAGDGMRFELVEATNKLTIYKDTGGGWVEQGTATLTTGSGTRQGVSARTTRNRSLIDSYQAGTL